MSTLAPKPSGHVLVTVYTTRQPAVAAEARCAVATPAPVTTSAAVAAAAMRGLRRRSIVLLTVVLPF